MCDLEQKILIKKTTISDAEICTDILFNTVIGKKYYGVKSVLLNEIKNGIENDEFYLAIDGKKNAIGILWYQLKGSFNSFPYLHMIAIKNEFQGNGFGNILMDFFEKKVLEDGRNHLRTKVFLTVADFNEKAFHLYKKRGYIHLCTIEKFFRKNINERVLMKEVVVES